MPDIGGLDRGNSSLLGAPRHDLYNIDCGRPLVPPHGGVKDVSDFTYPNTVTFVCEAGYVLQGDNIIRCESNGRWSNTAPRCHPIDEPFPWWVLLIGVVIFVPLTSYVLVKCLMRHCRSRRATDASSEDEEEEAGDEGADSSPHILEDFPVIQACSDSYTKSGTDHERTSMLHHAEAPRR